MESGEEGAHGGSVRGAGGGQVVRAQRDAVLGDQQRHPEEAFGQEPGEGGRLAGGGMAEVDRAEALLVVPVQRERAQRALQLGGEGEVVGDGGVLHGAAGPTGAGGGLQDPDGGLGAQGEMESAAFAGQLGEAVEPFGEQLRAGALARFRTGLVGGADRVGRRGR